MDAALITAVRRALRDAGGDRAGSHFLLAVSGGADSMALLELFLRLAPRAGYRLTVAHLDHGLRGRAGRADAAFVAARCRAAGVACEIGRAAVRAHARRTGVSLEMAARECRHDFLRAVADRVGADAVVTAHTADDQAETVLLKLLRGSGPAGLAGIAPRVILKGRLFVHPLLTVTRAEVESFLRRIGSDWRTDASNRDRQFLRNRIRHELIPRLERDYNPGLRRVLVETAERLRAEEEAMSGWASRALRRGRDAAGALHPDRLRGEPAAIRRRVWVTWLLECGADPERLTHPTILRLASAPAPGPEGRVRRVAGLELREREGVVTAHPASRPVVRPAPAPRPVRLRVPGVTELPGLNLRVTVERGAAFRRAGPEGIGRYPAWAVIRDPGVGVVRVRTWRPGDRLAVRGVGHRKVQDILTDLKIPRADRPRVAVVTVGDEIAWVPGYRVSREWEVDPRSTDRLRLTLEARA